MSPELDAESETVLARFLTGLRAAVPLTALWAHGSLALGDYRPGRSDFDLIAVVPTDLAGPEHDRLRDRLRDLHTTLAEDLAKDLPSVAKLHCTYVPEAALPDVGRRHVTWAHGELFDRPVTPVSRRELLTGNLALYGPPPAGLLPPVTDADLAAFIRADLRDYWHPATSRRTPWLRDIWIDLGLLTLARATVTLQHGTLITKGEALDVLPALGAPPRVIADVRDRRYADSPHPPSPYWRLTRAHLTRPYLHTAIPRALSGGSDGGGR